MSVRLKLTLSYAGFLMLAGSLMLAAIWLFFLRYVPADSIYRLHPSWWFRIPSDPLNGFGSVAAIVLGGLLIVGLFGGWLLAGRMLSPLARVTDATRRAASGSLSHRIQLPGRSDEFRELADAFDTMLSRLEAHVAEQQRFAANASHELRTPLAITQTLLDVARNDPDNDTAQLLDRLYKVNGRAIDLTEALLLLSRADRRFFAPEPIDLSLLAEEATETLLPLAEKRGVLIETLRRRDPHQRLTRAPAADDDESRAQRDRPQSARAGEGVCHDPGAARQRRADGREHRRTAHPAAGVDDGRAVPPRHRARTRQPRRRRTRPGDRQEHHRGTPRNAHPHPEGGRRALRPGASARGSRVIALRTAGGQYGEPNIGRRLRRMPWTPKRLQSLRLR